MNVSALTGAKNSRPPPRFTRGQGHALRPLPLDAVVHAQSREPDDRKIECVQLRRLWRLPKGEPTFANHFKAQGYATAVAGKWQLLTTQTGISPKEAGFDRHCVWNIPGTARSRYWKPSLMHDGKVINHGEEKYGSTVIADYLIDFIKTNKDKPFLAYYPMNLPHNPFDPTPRSKDRKSKNVKRNFIDMVAYMDHCVGRIEDALIELGLRENTLLIFTADNGTNSSLTLDFFGTQRRGGKGYTHDHGTKVPLIVNLPGRIQAGQVNKDLICFSDLFPTIVEAANLPAKKITQGDGWSFWPQCLGKEGKKREWIYGYYFPRPFSKQFDTMYSHWEVAWARNKRYKLYRDGRFFDVINDVREEKPLSERAQPSVGRARACRRPWTTIRRRVPRLTMSA